MPDPPKPPPPLFPADQLHALFVAALPEVLPKLEFYLGVKSPVLRRKEREWFSHKLELMLRRGQPYFLGFLALSGAASKERLEYALIEGLAKEFLQTMGMRIGKQDGCAFLLTFLERKLRARTRPMRLACYRNARGCLTNYVGELRREDIMHLQSVLEAWSQTSEARKNVTYLRNIDAAIRRYRKRPPQRITRRLLLELQDEYKNSAALFELRLRLLLACRSEKDLTYWSQQSLNNLLAIAGGYDSLRPLLNVIDRHVRNALAHGWAIPNLRENNVIFHDRHHEVSWTAQEFYKRTRCLTVTAHALCEMEMVFILESFRKVIHGIWQYVAEPR